MSRAIKTHRHKKRLTIAASSHPLSLFLFPASTLNRRILKLKQIELGIRKSHEVHSHSRYFAKYTDWYVETRGKVYKFALKYKNVNMSTSQVLGGSFCSIKRSLIYFHFHVSRVNNNDNYV